MQLPCLNGCTAQGSARTLPTSAWPNASWIDDLNPFRLPLLGTSTTTEGLADPASCTLTTVAQKEHTAVSGLLKVWVVSCQKTDAENEVKRNYWEFLAIQRLRATVIRDEHAFRSACTLHMFAHIDASVLRAVLCLQHVPNECCAVQWSPERTQHS